MQSETSTIVTKKLLWKIIPRLKLHVVLGSGSTNVLAFIDKMPENLTKSN